MLSYDIAGNIPDAAGNSDLPLCGTGSIDNLADVLFIQTVLPLTFLKYSLALINSTSSGFYFSIPEYTPEYRLRKTGWRKGRANDGIDIAVFERDGRITLFRRRETERRAADDRHRTFRGENDHHQGSGAPQKNAQHRLQEACGACDE